MAQGSPIIQDGILTDLRDGSPVQIVVDSCDWYSWLQTASTFTFRGEDGSFTAHKERAGNRRGRAYWRAYRTWQGKLHRAYLGQSEDLTLERLRAIAAVLTGQAPLEEPSQATAHEPAAAPLQIPEEPQDGQHRSFPTLTPRSAHPPEPEHRPSFRRGFPTGTLTLLFTDIEGSTQLLQQVGERYAHVLSECRHVLRTAFVQYNGFEVDTQGDACFVVFARATDAVSAAVTVQRALASHGWPEGVTVRVRMGVHTGEPQVSSEGYVGLDVHYAARLMQAGHGGQVLLSQTTRDLVAHDLPEGVRLRTLGEHRLKNIERPSHLFQLDIAGLPADFPPLKTLGAYLNTLPAPLTPLIGREQEMQTICQLLSQPEVRLLTITGTGGVGKTRLALHVAAEGGDTFADGVCFVPLAPISDPGQVMPVIAKALGLWEALDRPLVDHVRDYLHEKHLLLLLDNFEHVAAAAPQLAALLVSCPRLHLLVTSRAALHLSGEYEFPVPPLPTPDLTQLEDAQALAQMAAVRLFVERAHAIQPAFQLTQANARTIAEICVRLDGLPLAIELAAARIKLLPPQALLHRLSHRLDLLTDGARDLPMRQQALRNTLQWSYDLLTSEEQRLFRWLCIFVGGCTLQAAETVCQAGQQDGVQTSSVLEGVASLLDKSLVQQTGQESQESQLVMLETIREFGLERLQAHQELEAAREAHAAYYLHLAEEAHRHLFGGEATPWFERVEQAYANLRAALEWALEDGDEDTGSERRIETAVRLVSVLWRFWNIRGYMSEGRAFVERVLARSEKCREPVRLKALMAAAMLAMYQEDATWGKRLHEELLPLSQRLADRHAEGIALFGLAGVALLQRRDLGRARILAEQAQAAFIARGETWMAAVVCLFLARLSSAQGEDARSRHHLEEGLALYRALGYAGDIAWPLIFLARNAMKQGEQTRARALLQEAIGLCQQVGNKWGLAHAVGFLGQLTLEQSDLVDACALLTESLQLKQETGNRRSIAASLFHLASALVLQGDIAQARTLYEQSLAIATALGHWELVASCLQGLAVALTAQAQPFTAVRLWGAAETLLPNNATTLPRLLRASVERAQTRARTQLGDKVFAQAKEEGRTMTAEQALAWQPAIPPQQAHLSTHPSSTAPTRPAPSPAGLTAREVEVLRLVAQGLTDAQVAERLVISHRTVTTHLSSIYNKLGINSRAAAARFAAEHQLI